MSQYELTLRDYWRVIRKRKSVIILTTVVLAASTYVISELRKPQPLYQATSQVKIEQTSNMAGLFVEMFTFSGGDNLATQTRIIKSFPVMEQVGKRLGVIPQTVSSEEVNKSDKWLDIISGIQDKIDTQQVEKTNIIEITSTSSNPEEAQKIANWTAEEFRAFNIFNKNKQVLEARKFIEQQLVTVGDRLKDAEESLKLFKESSGLMALSEEVSTSIKNLVDVESEYRQTMEVKNEIQSQIEAVKQKRVAAEKPTPRIFTDKELSLTFKLNSDLLNLQLKRDNLLLNNFPEHPLVKDVDAQIENVRSELLRDLDAKLKTYQSREDSLALDYYKLRQQYQKLPDKALTMARLQREVTVNEELFSLLKSKHQEVLIKESEKIEEVSLVKPALYVSVPINPPQTTRKTLVGAVIGFMLGLVLSFVSESFDTSIGTIEDVESYLELPVLGVIPYFESKAVKKYLTDSASKHFQNHEHLSSYHLALHFMPKSPLVESYRSLRTSVQFAALKSNAKVLLLTSTSLREGKTSTAINLAITLSQTGKRVLLVDADLRKPTIHHILGIEKSPGLSDILIGHVQWETCVQTITDLLLGNLGFENIITSPGVDNIHIITCGTLPQNPSEFLNSEQIEDLIAIWKSHYDYVLFDTPPTLPITDAVILSSKVDGVIIVYQVSKIARTALKRTKLLLESVHAKVLGVVLNSIRAEVSPDFFQFSYNLYRYYGHEDQAKIKAKGKQ